MTAPMSPALRRQAAPIALARAATCWLFFANGAALGSWLPHIPDAKHTLGLGDMVLGLALRGMAAGSLVGLPLSGVLTARFGSRRTATVAILALLVITPLPLLAPTLPAFAVTLALLGVANGAVDVAMNAQAIAVEERFGRPILSSFHGLFSAGGLVGAAVASLSMTAGVGPMSHLLGAVGVLLAITLVAVGSLLPTTPSPAAAAAVFRLPRGPLVALGLLALCALLAEGAIGDWAAVYLRDDLRADAATAGLGFAALSLAMAAGRFCGDRLVRRFGGPAVLARGAGIAASGSRRRPGAGQCDGGACRFRRGRARAGQRRADRLQRRRQGPRDVTGACTRCGFDSRVLRVLVGPAADRPRCRAARSRIGPRYRRDCSRNRRLRRDGSGNQEIRRWTGSLNDSRSRKRAIL
jgi:predicted MFS family arabinose efflux permease